MCSLGKLSLTLGIFHKFWSGTFQNSQTQNSPRSGHQSLCRPHGHKNKVKKHNCMLMAALFSPGYHSHLSTSPIRLFLEPVTVSLLLLLSLLNSLLLVSCLAQGEFSRGYGGAFLQKESSDSILSTLSWEGVLEFNLRSQQKSIVQFQHHQASRGGSGAP